MTSSDRSPDFDPDNVETIAGWVLEYPFLNWTPSSREYPSLTIATEDLGPVGFVVEGVIGHGAFGVVLQCTIGSLGPMKEHPLQAAKQNRERLAVKIPRIRRSAGVGVTDIGEALDKELDINPQRADQTFLRRAQEQCQQLANGLASVSLDQVMQTFRNETSMLARLHHDSIVRLRMSGEIIVGESQPDGRQRTLPCIVMEYVRGARLSEVISEAQTSHLETDLPLIFRNARDLALALACIHDRRSCHRDLSWNNILLSKNDIPVIIDLGNVALPEDPPEMQIVDGPQGVVDTLFVPFTKGFVAPEHREGTMVIDGRADQFSLGVVLYLWCAGTKAGEYRWPFDLDTGEAVMGTDSQTPRKLSELRKHLIRAWQDPTKKAFQQFSRIIHQMMSWHREDRHDSLRDIAAEVEMLLLKLGAGKADPIPAHELKLDKSFKRLCKHASIPASESAACLILQILVRQTRQQISEAITYIWDTVFEIWTDSKLDSRARSVRLHEEGRQMETKLKGALSVVLRTFSETQITGHGVPRFGGQLQQIIGDAISHANVPSRLRADQTRPESLHAHIDGQWEYFSQRQQQLADVDFRLALYSLQLSERLSQ